MLLRCRLKAVFLVQLLFIIACSQKSIDQGLSPKLFNEENYTDFKDQISPIPKITSQTQADDEKTLRDYQVTRNATDCEKAQSYLSVSLDNFFGPKRGILTDAEINDSSYLASLLINDALYFSTLLKKDFARSRPYLYLNDIKPCVSLENTYSYPSAHALIAELLALCLSNKYPTKALALHAQSEIIGESRVLSGVHHPSDIKAGKELAKLMYAMLVSSGKLKDLTQSH